MKTFDKVAWALVAAVGALFLLVGCSGGGPSTDSVKVEIPTTKAIAGLVRSTDAVATVVLNNAVVGEKLRLTIEEDRDADAAKLIVEIPSQALKGVRGAPARRQDGAPGGGLAILITDPTGSTIFVSVQVSAVDMAGNEQADPAVGTFKTDMTAPAPLASGWAATKPTTGAVSTTDGSKTVKVYVKDAARNVSAFASASITLDTVAPANPTLALKDNNCSACSDTNEVSVLVTIGNDSGVDKYLVSESQSTSPAESASGFGAKPAGFTLSSGEGTKTVYVWVKDAAGNINGSAVSASIVLDTSNPTVGTLATTTNVACGGSTCVKGGAFNISATITGGPSNIASCRFTTDGSAWSAGVWGGSSRQASNVACTDNTKLSINMEGTDNAGNAGTGSAINDKKCDGAAPTFAGLTSATLNLP